jgi:hypothetical protein
MNKPEQENSKAPVIQLPLKNRALTSLRDEIKALVYTYEGRASLAEAIGILEIVKVELLHEHEESL